MIYKYLPITLLLAINCAAARGSVTDTSEQSSVMTIAQNNAKLSMHDMATSVTSYSRYSGGGGGGVHGFYDIELGYAHFTTKSGSTSLSGGGFKYGGEIGVKIGLPSRSQTRGSLLSVAVSFSAFAVKDKYKDLQGDSKTDTRNFGIIGLPISYTSVGYGRNGSGTGFYWQAGLNSNYVYSVKDNSTTVTSHYNNIYFEPSVCVGFSAPFRLIQRHTGDEVGHGRAFMGLFFSDAVTNLAKDSGVTMHGYSIGIRWAYVFM